MGGKTIKRNKIEEVKIVVSGQGMSIVLIGKRNMGSFWGPDNILFLELRSYMSILFTIFC